MFRTRDFVLYLITIAFLLVAIGYTVIERQATDDRLATFLYSTQAEISDVTVTIASSEKNSPSREERLEQLRDKIKNSELIGISETLLIEPVPHDEAATTSALTITEPVLCVSHVGYDIVDWPISELSMEFTEGARQYYIEIPSLAGTISSSTISQKKMLLVLPTPFVPFGSPSCLQSDVIGVSLDGSLIRNSEINLYGIFETQTLVGYALDGFPIYGTGTNETDNCGGRIEQGQYRYELSKNRETVLNCFAGKPQNLHQ